MRSPHQRPRSRKSPEAVEGFLDGLCTLHRSPPDLATLRFGGDVSAANDLVLFAGGLAVDKTGRAALLAKLRGGEQLPEVEIELVAYIQRATPNRNFVRFKNSIANALARSFKGQPFLKDHDSHDLISRGGTIVDARLEKTEGEWSIILRAKLVKAWAIEGVLDGTIDRFSIGWSRTGPVECSLHGTPVFTHCDCYPGDMIKGELIEFVFTAAEGTEVSAVNVPAVVGTGIQTISQLTALDRAQLKDILGVETTPERKENMLDPQIIAKLGLQPTASLPEVLAAIGQLADQNTILASTKATLASELKALKDSEATRAAADRKVIVDTSIAQLCAQGKLKPGSEAENALRRMAERDVTSFTEQVKDMLSAGITVTPAGAALPGASRDPVPAASVTSQPATGKDYLASNPTVAKMLHRAGITQDEFEKHGAGARQNIADYAAASGR